VLHAHLRGFPPCLVCFVQQAQDQFWVLDDKGLLTVDRAADMDAGQTFFARDDTKEYHEGMSLLEVIKKVCPLLSSYSPGLHSFSHLLRLACGVVPRSSQLFCWV